MPYTPIATQGTKLQIKILGVYTDVPGMVSMNPVGTARALIDVTDLNATIRKYMLAIPDGQEIACEMWFSPGETAQEAIRQAHLTQAQTDFKVILTDAGAWEIQFTGVVMNFNRSFEIDNAVKATFSLKPSGSLTEVP